MQLLDLQGCKLGLGGKGFYPAVMHLSVASLIEKTISITQKLHGASLLCTVLVLIAHTSKIVFYFMYQRQVIIFLLNEYGYLSLFVLLFLIAQ